MVKPDFAVSVVVPCYNEQESIEALYRRATDAIKAVVGESYELILVNDGSKDQTWSLIDSLVERDSHVVGINLSRNFGHQMAVTAVLSFARGPRVMIIDADLQDPPELLGPMMAAMDEGADVVYGQRAARAGETWFKKTTASLFYRILQSLSDVDIPRDVGDFRLMNRKTVDAILSMPEQSRFLRGMVSWVGYHQVALLYDRHERVAGVTKYPLRKMLIFARDAIIGFSLRPIRVTIHIALIVMALALLLLFYVAVGWLAGNAVQGWTSLLGSLLLLSGVQLFCLGIVGEYVAHIFLEVKRRPLFLIRQIRRQDETVSVPSETQV
ncbi:MAG: glycosyltransferase family 2 protein [Rhodospirillaceae bacterium]